MPWPLILIVEDGDKQREFLQTALQGMRDFILENVRSAADAHLVAETRQPDLVFFDLASQQAGESLDAGETIRRAGIPVIYINGPRASEPIFPEGDTPIIYFPKPVSSAAVTSAVDLALQYRSMQKRMCERQAAYQASIELLPGALGMFDRHTQRLLEANEAFTNLFQLHDGRSEQASLPELLKLEEGSLEHALQTAGKFGCWSGRAEVLGIDRDGVGCQARIRPVEVDNENSPWMVYCTAGWAGKIGIEEKTIEVIERHRQEAETLREVTASLTKSLEPNEVLHRILEQMKKVIPYEGFSVMLWEDNQLILYASHDRPGTRREIMDIQELPNIKEVIENKRPLIIPDTTKDPRWILLPGYEYIRCWMGVPLIADDRVVGLLNLDKKEAEFYQQKDTRLALAFANQATIALENARLHQRTQRGLKRLSALRTIDNAISSSLDLRFTLEVLLNQVISNLDVDATDVLLFNERNQNSLLRRRPRLPYRRAAPHPHPSGGGLRRAGRLAAPHPVRQ